MRGGVELRVAEDGEEALALVAQWSPTCWCSTPTCPA